MKSKRQSIVDELLSGVFGWFWILGIISVVALAALAVFSDWSWWYVACALIFSSVSKAVARSFMTDRVRSTSPADTNLAAVTASTLHIPKGSAVNKPDNRSPVSGSSPSADRIRDNQRQAQERARIIAAFGAFLEKNASGALQVHDVKRLPFDKQTILDAIYLEIVGERDPKRIEALKISALSLAEYQEGVGDKSISFLGVDMTSIDPTSLTDEDRDALIKRIAHNPDAAKYEKLKPLVERDTAEIMKKVRAAEFVGQNMPEEKKREVFG